MHCIRIKKVIIMLLSISICLCLTVSCSSKSGPNKSGPNKSDPNKSDPNKSSPNQSNAPPSEANVNYSNWREGLLYTSLALNALCLALIVVLFRRQMSFSSMREGYNSLRGMNDRITELKENKPIDLDQIISKKIKEHFRQDDKKQQQEGPGSMIEQKSIIEKSKTPEILYASQAEKESNSFYEIKGQPNDSTVYELKLIGGDKAEFRTYAGAQEKILGAPGCLDWASEIIFQGGKQGVVTVVPGIVTKNQNGGWDIVQKAKIKFE